ncbi:MAG TPA: hypothetical protein PLB38_02805 [bacterium]|mgnify:CR=1 FL=1|nr:hypothetical protein [bacterium]
MEKPKNLNVMSLPEKWPSDKCERYQAVMDKVITLGSEIKILVDSNREAFYSDEDKYREKHHEIRQKAIGLRSELAETILLLDRWVNELGLQDWAYKENMKEISKMDGDS